MSLPQLFNRTLRFVTLLLTMGLCHGSESPLGAWTYVPDGEDETGYPWRIVLLSSDTIESQTLLLGVRQTQKCKAKVSEEYIEFANEKGYVIRLLRKDGFLFLHEKHLKGDTVFKPSAEWDAKFEQAPPIPRTKAEALITLRKILGPEGLEQIRSMKEDDLIGMHFGLGMGIRNAFGLWTKGSPLLADLGGGHPDDASMGLIGALWHDLQKEKQSSAKR